MKRRQILLVSLTLGTLAMAGAAFGQSAHTSATRAVVNTRNTSLGMILVDSAGHTLYLDANDKPGHFACTGQCAQAWPALTTSGSPKAAGKAKASLLGTVKHGKLTQVTYNHHPLYTFLSDTKSNPTSGEGVNSFFVVSTSGNKLTKSTTTTTTSSSSSSGYYR